MFSSLRLRWRDMGTIKSLCFGAERIANARGRTDPGAEDFLLSALELPDGTARRAFARIQADPDSLRAAIDRQYQDALRNVGIAVADRATLTTETVPVSPRKLPKAAPSGQALIDTMIRDIRVAEAQQQTAAPLLGAHVVLAATMNRLGVVARALRTMGVDAAALADAARAEIGDYRLQLR